MPLPRFDFRLDAEALVSLSEREVQALADLTPFWESEADPLVRGWFRQMFETEGAAGGERWAPLSPATQKLKEADGRGGMPLLRWTDTMYRSLVNRADPNQRKAVSPTAFFLGTGATHDGFPYPLMHQRGWTMHNFYRTAVAPRSVLPRRLVLKSFPIPGARNWSARSPAISLGSPND